MFGGLFGRSDSGKKKSNLKKLSTGVESSIIEAVGNKSIPPMPGAAQKAFQLATDPKAEARDFVEVIESDEGLSARVLKIANSVYFDRGKSSKTIEESVVVIGMNELRCLLNATTLSEIFPSRHPARPQLWENDISTAIFSRILAQRVDPNRAEVAFLSGLMHDIGKLLLIQRTGEDYQKIIKKVEESAISFVEAETSLFPFDHTEVGQLIAQRWNFSDEVIEAIKCHHDSWNSFDISRSSVPLAAIVKAADTFSHSLGIGHPRGFTRFKNRSTESLGEIWEIFSIPEEERKSLMSQMERTFSTEKDLYLSKGGRSE